MTGGRVQVFLVALDRSEFARTALVAARELSNRVQADVYILSVVARPDQVADIEAELAALRLPDRIADISVVIGDAPARVINQTLHDLGSAALCMATHARGLRPFGLGPMAYEALAAGAAPVILVGPSLGYPEGIPSTDDPIHLEKFRGGGVVVCVDGGERSASLAATARPWAQALSEPLIVLTVAEPDAPLLGDEVPDKLYGPPGNVNAFLDRLTTPLRGEDVVVESGRSSIRSGPPRVSAATCKSPRRPWWSSAVNSGAAGLCLLGEPGPRPPFWGGAPHRCWWCPVPRTSRQPASPGIRGPWWRTPWSPWGAAITASWDSYNSRSKM